MSRDRDRSPPESSPLHDAAEGLKRAAHDEIDGARNTLNEATKDISEKASAIAEDAKEAALDKAEVVKEGLSSSLKTFGEALRAAGDSLAHAQPSASTMMAEAATALEQLSSSFESKPVSELIGEVRSFGHKNAGGLFAGSVLAGLALGRLLKSAESAPTRSDSPTEPDSVKDAVYRPTAGAD